jgi:uncharacterized protein
MKYQAVPYQIFDGQDGAIIHFSEDTLALTELDALHCTLLSSFAQKCTIDEVIAIHGSDEDSIDAINELVELKLVASSQSPPPIAVLNLRPNVCAFRIVLTEKCNLRCAECFVVKNADKLRTMSQETIGRVICATIPYGATQRVTYHFFGGEPLLRFDLIKYAVAKLEAAVAQGLMIRPIYAITTNLTLLDNDIIAFFKEYDFKVGVSVDGPEEVNDQLRVYADGRGTFKKVQANYKRLVEEGIDSHVLITPNPDFLDELPDIFTSVLKMFPMQTVTVNTPLHFDTVQWNVPGERYAKLLIQLMGIAHEYGVDVDSAASPPLAALAGNIKRESPCALTCDAVMASVSPDGSMSYCAQKWHQFLTVSMDGSGTTLQTPMHRENECLTCSARNICGGPCPAYQQIARAKLDINKCEFMRTLLREVSSNLVFFEDQ